MFYNTKNFYRSHFGSRPILVYIHPTSKKMGDFVSFSDEEVDAFFAQMAAELADASRATGTAARPTATPVAHVAPVASAASAASAAFRFRRTFHRSRSPPSRRFGEMLAREHTSQIVVRGMAQLEKMMYLGLDTESSVPDLMVRFPEQWSCHPSHAQEPDCTR